MIRRFVHFGVLCIAKYVPGTVKTVLPNQIIQIFLTL
jgi:hypothetical protein